MVAVVAVAAATSDGSIGNDDKRQRCLQKLFLHKTRCGDAIDKQQQQKTACVRSIVRPKLMAASMTALRNGGSVTNTHVHSF